MHYPDSLVTLWQDLLHNNTSRSRVRNPLEISLLPGNMFLPACSKISCLQQVLPSLMQRIIQNAREKPVHCCYGKTTKLFRPFVFERGLASDVADSRKDADVLIIGGGAMGSSAAYFIKSKSPNTNVIVVERDPKYLQASTTLSVSSIRQQFSITENINLSMWSYQFMKEIGTHLLVPEQDVPDVQLQDGAYVFMASEMGQNILSENFELQSSLGACVCLHDCTSLKEKYSWINTDGLHSACVGEANEGWFDPWSLLQSFRRKAASLGVQYIDTEALHLTLDDKGMIGGAQIRDPSNPDTSFHLSCDKLINAAGPWAGFLAQTIGIDLPVRPRKRYVFVIDCPKGPKDMVLAVDTSGCWFRKEGKGSLYLCGKSPDEDNDPDATDLDVDYSYFENEIWPCLAERVPAFEELKVQHSWAGFYEYNTFDQNGIVGAHPEVKNLYFMNGFSGHGIQQSPAVGNAISELIVDGKYSTIDLTRFGYQRIIDNVLLKEKNIV
eukprot:Seg1289.11 transcript_id=Seg1289.11/GoldUCD/mRNA.D3Y31 product="FAD-dependent oxidoreductase domain-containing protein 1" protein_id=Seg1289.11/GoldUCD/D3Y31